MRILLRLYSIYFYIIFIIAFIIVIPIILFLAQFKNLERAALKVNRYWSWVFFKMIFIPVKFSFEQKLPKDQNYIFCANHFSYIDIPVIAGLPFPFKYIGKSSIKKIPVFGYMFAKLHITVDRSSIKNRAESLRVSREAIQRGFNITFFPEGGIITVNPPHMVNFKDGAFRLSIEENVPIVPVTMPDNYKILPDDNAYLFRPKKCKVIVHKPIYPADHNYDLESIKAATKTVIEQELLRHHSKNVPSVH
ncbi:MAG: 1-acyl-sn-glycerol-3-phosphate acyltransferase [Cyclobacteriaceae bacterium]|jgi:1-acyl-sn-glycerol-3-phosphate acyltransferase